MKLKVLGSGSSGNCYILENENEALIIEAGVSMKEVKVALNFDIKKIVGVVISHCHGDHAKYINVYRDTGIPVFDAFRLCELNRGRFGKVAMGNFLIDTFSLVHDVPCYGFLISHPEMGRLIYASDTEFITWRFKDIQHFLVEANYSKDLIPEDIEETKREHVFLGHMEIDTTCRFLKANHYAGTRNVVLLHLSNDNADPEQFNAKAEQVVNCPVYVAGPGLEVDLSLYPF